MIIKKCESFRTFANTTSRVRLLKKERRYLDSAYTHISAQFEGLGFCNYFYISSLLPNFFELLPGFFGANPNVFIEIMQAFVPAYFHNQFNGCAGPKFIITYLLGFSE